MAGISSKALAFGDPRNKEKTFQGQRFDDELGLNWIQFKWRNHDPQIGRFVEIDPLSDKYVYNSTYAFSENKVTAHIELEGLESITIKEAFNQSLRPPSQVINEGLAGLGLKSNKVIDFIGGLLDVGDKMTNPITTIRGLADGAKEQQLQAERIAGGEGTFFDYARIGDPGNVIGTAKGLFDQGKAAVNGDMNAGGQLTGTVLLMMLGGKSASGSKSPGSFTFADEANVVRGGMCQPKQFVMGTHPSGVTGFSAETGTMSVNELSKALPNNQVGVTTVGKIRAIGGDVIKTAGRSPNHSTVTGLNGEQASKLFSPTIKNPFKL